MFWVQATGYWLHFQDPTHTHRDLDRTLSRPTLDLKKISLTQTGTETGTCPTSSEAAVIFSSV